VAEYRIQPSERVNHPTSKESHSRGPLTGIRVLDLSSYIAGPHGASLLADLGADVIKVEPPHGDNLRQYPSSLEKESRAFLGTNRSKRGIALDLKKPGGLAVLVRLAEKADVLIHNFRPSVPRRLGIDYETLRTRNPRLIYCALTGYGESGPLKDKAGYDQVLQCMTGIAAFQSARGAPEIVLGSVVDYYAGCMIASGVLAALFHRERTGEGQHVGVSLLASALAMQSGRFIWADSEALDIERDMRSGGVTGIHPTREGYLYLSANTPEFWRSLCELIGLPELAVKPEYDTVRKRARRTDEIVPVLRVALQERTAREWEALFGERVPCATVGRMEDMFDHPQVLAEELVAHVDHPSVSGYCTIRRPIKFSAAPGPEPFGAPALGQDTEEVLFSCGYSDEEIERLRRDGAIPG
jgi:formyl-CoA transferase